MLYKSCFIVFHPTANGGEYAWHSSFKTLLSFAFSVFCVAVCLYSSALLANKRLFSLTIAEPPMSDNGGLNADVTLQLPQTSATLGLPTTYSLNYGHVIIGIGRRSACLKAIAHVRGDKIQCNKLKLPYKNTVCFIAVRAHRTE